MPLYDYDCQQCGVFTAWAPMAEAMAPGTCPHCSQPSRRIISAPRLATMRAENRQAWERNEKSAHEPRAVQRSHSHRCDGSCNHDKPKPAKPTRPWMLGH